MEFVDGVTLSSLIGKHRCDAETRKRIMEGIYKGLRHLRLKGIIHREICSDKILVDRNTLTPKLVDFGLSYSTSEIPIV